MSPMAGCRLCYADFEPKPLPIHVVHQEGRRASAKLRAFVDFIVDRIRANPALKEPIG